MSLHQTSQYDNDYSIYKGLMRNMINSLHTVYFGVVKSISSNKKAVISITDTTFQDNLNFSDDAYTPIGDVELTIINLLYIGYAPKKDDAVMVLCPCEDNSKFLENEEYQSPVKFNLGNAVAIPIIKNENLEESERKIDIGNNTVDVLNLEAKKINLKVGNNTLIIDNTGVTINGILFNDHVHISNGSGVVTNPPQNGSA